MIKQLYPAFQHWAENGAVWLFSDPHWDDEQIAGAMQNRPDNWEIVDNINARVGSTDTIIFLGDIGNAEYIRNVRPKAHKVLIMGNHDDKGLSYYESFFDEVYDGPVMIARNVMLSHEPMTDYPFIFNIHGHVHQPHYVNAANELNVCLDALDKPYPVNLNRMFKRGRFSTLEVKDIHRATINKATERKRKRIAAGGKFEYDI